MQKMKHLMIRPDLHAQIAKLAEAKDVTINSLVTSLLEADMSILELLEHKEAHIPKAKLKRARRRHPRAIELAF